MEECQSIAVKLWASGKTYGEVARITGRTRDSIRWEIRKHKKANISKNTIVGIIGDIHAPFNHPGYLDFCKETFIKAGVNEVVFIGDIVDMHAISRHQSNPKSKSAYDEYDLALNEIGKFSKAFPEAKVCIGNHDAIPYRQAATLGMGDIFLKDFKQLWNLPEEWEISNEFIIDDVLYKHGINCGGKDGAINTAIQERMSTVIGHMHSNGGCKYVANNQSLIFGLNVGCGVDINSYGMEYGIHFKNKPTLGCGIVRSKQEAYFVPMA